MGSTVDDYLVTYHLRNREGQKGQEERVRRMRWFRPYWDVRMNVMTIGISHHDIVVLQRLAPIVNAINWGADG